MLLEQQLSRVTVETIIHEDLGTYTKRLKSMRAWLNCLVTPILFCRLCFFWLLFFLRPRGLWRHYCLETLRKLWTMWKLFWRRFQTRFCHQFPEALGRSCDDSFQDTWRCCQCEFVLLFLTTQFTKLFRIVLHLIHLAQSASPSPVDIFCDIAWTNWHGSYGHYAAPHKLLTEFRNKDFYFLRDIMMNDKNRRLFIFALSSWTHLVPCCSSDIFSIVIHVSTISIGFFFGLIRDLLLLQLCGMIGENIRVYQCRICALEDIGCAFMHLKSFYICT